MSTILPQQDAYVASADAVVLERLFLLVRLTGTHGAQHPTTFEKAEQLVEAIAEAQPPFALQFVREATFRDKQLIPLNLEGFQRTEVLSRALSNCGVQELALDGLPEVETLLKLGEALARGQQGPSDVLEGLRLPLVRWREIPGARWGAEATDIDPDLYAVTQVSLAVADADRLALDPTQPWDWPAGVGVVRRLERSLQVHHDAALRAAEFAPPPWSAGRRAVAMTLYLLAALRAVGVQDQSQRALAHGALCLACAGLAQPKPPGLATAAQQAFARLAATPLGHAGSASRHRLRVCAVVQGATRTEPSAAAGPNGLLQLVYQLEMVRQPLRGRFALTMADLLGRALQAPAGAVEPGWLRALIQAVGALPPGARVRLPDGRVGLVLEAGSRGHAWRPKVLVGAQVVEPTTDVELVAAIP